MRNNKVPKSKMDQAGFIGKIARNSIYTHLVRRQSKISFRYVELKYYKGLTNIETFG